MGGKNEGRKTLRSETFLCETSQSLWQVQKVDRSAIQRSSTFFIFDLSVESFCYSSISFFNYFFFNFSMTDIHSEMSMIADKNVCLFSIAIDVNWKLLLWPYGSSFQSKAFSLNIFLRIKRGFLRIHWKYHTSWKLL